MGSMIDCDRCGRTARTVAEARGWLHLEDLYHAGLFHPPLDHEALDAHFCSPLCLIWYATTRWPELGKLLRSEVVKALELESARGRG